MASTLSCPRCSVPLNDGLSEIDLCPNCKCVIDNTTAIRAGLALWLLLTIISVLIIYILGISVAWPILGSAVLFGVLSACRPINRSYWSIFSTLFPPKTIINKKHAADLKLFLNVFVNENKRRIIENQITTELLNINN